MPPARKRTTTQRGLGWAHQEQRRTLLARLVDGAPCWWCGKPMHRDDTRNWDGAALAADHSLARSHGGTKADRLLHATCNKSRGDGGFDHLRPAVTGKPLAEAKAEARAAAEAARDRARWCLLPW